MNNFNEAIIFNDANEIAKEFSKNFKKKKKYKWIITGGAGFLLSYFSYIVEVLVEKYNLNIRLFVYDSLFWFV